MTRNEWLTATNPSTMLFPFLAGRVSDRKLRLFASACCRRLSSLYPAEFVACESIIAIAEECADGGYDPFFLQSQTMEFVRGGGLTEKFCGLSLSLLHLGFPDPLLAAMMTWRSAVEDGADLLRCIVGIPFPKEEPRRRSWGQAALSVLAQLVSGSPHQPAPVAHELFVRPSIDPSWRTEAVVGLARGMYESRDFGQMPVLADALEDAGCGDPEVLAHCRGGGPHVRGCWVVDLVLGKE